MVAFAAQVDAWTLADAMDREDGIFSLDNGLKICVPDDLRSLTRYVLEEQGDWFEREIHFVRRFIEPGMHALDVGANYGLYTTAIASSMKSSGRLWSFEPAPMTAARLRNTVAANDFGAVVQVVEAGLSDSVRRAAFYIRTNAEGNSLVPEDGGNVVDVELSTMDACQDRFSWPAIDFMKLDAEGEEEKILKGGQRFFSQQSPLIMFEFKGVTHFNTHLIDAFADIGYLTYYLVPGLNVLAPFDVQRDFDQDLVNLFAIKRESIPELRHEEVLVEDPGARSEEDLTDVLPASLSGAMFYANLPVDSHDLDGLQTPYREILLAYCGARDETLTQQQRFDLLMLALQLTKAAVTGGFMAKREQLSTLARVAFDAGKTEIGNKLLGFLLSYPGGLESFEFHDMFIPASSHFESIDSRGRSHAWFHAMVLDQLVRSSSHSTYFGGDEEALQHIDKMEALGFASGDMLRRAATIRRAQLT